MQGNQEQPRFDGYGIEAQETLRSGVRFRSKLEAMWSSFFDLAGIPWEYEPVRLDGWIPDFRLFGKFLCEVKPIQMTGFSVASTEYQWIRKTRGYGQVLIFGLRPSSSLACLVTSDQMTVGGRTVLFDPDAKYRMVSVDGDGGNHPLLGSAETLWRQAVQPRQMQAISRLKAKETA